MYKTMVLELLRQREALYAQLREKEMLLPTLESCAKRLKASHEEQMALLSLAKPESDPSQIKSEALEIALQELEDCLPSGSQPDDSDPPTLEAAIAFIRRHTPPA